jgi:hypothetical protein
MKKNLAQNINYVEKSVFYKPAKGPVLNIERGPSARQVRKMALLWWQSIFYIL